MMEQATIRGDSRDLYRKTFLATSLAHSQCSNLFPESAELRTEMVIFSQENFLITKYTHLHFCRTQNTCSWVVHRFEQDTLYFFSAYFIVSSYVFYCLSYIQIGH